MGFSPLCEALIREDNPNRVTKYYPTAPISTDNSSRNDKLNYAAKEFLCNERQSVEVVKGKKVRKY